MPTSLPSYDELFAENTVLKALIVKLEARITDLEARLKMTSQNSSKPPSADGLAKPAPKSLRGKSGRKPGRPAGQPGVTLEQVAVPDAEVSYAPAACGRCGDDLAGAVVVGVERRQVFDLPEPKLEVTEHQIFTLQCRCGHQTRGRQPEGVNAPVCYGPRIAGIGVYLLHGQFLSKTRTAQALDVLFGVPVAPQTVATWVRRTALGIIDKVLPVIGGRITASDVAHFDETGFRTAGKLAWMHSASTPTDVLLTVHPRRGTEAMNDAGILPGFQGVAVHDAWAPYDCYTEATHALCNAHALRELVYVTDTAAGPTADMAVQAIDAMLALKKLVDDAQATQTSIDSAARDHHAHLLRSAVLLGIEATAARSSELQRKHNALFVRLRDRRDDYLRFLYDPQVPWDNNAAERTIRMPKLRIKVSGSMRTLAGARDFAAIRSYTATAARHSRNILDTLTQAATGQPWIPDTA
ncbi:MAG: IS66 family transposase [Longispora sp.]|nr:IS66 family transposase [Longispora sp. (in: high G+C Gram-positive bacteria)]